MKKLFFLAAIAVMLITASCNSSSNDPLDRSQYEGTYIVVTTGSVEYETDSSTTKTIPIILGDEITITADPNSSTGMTVEGKIFKGTATVTSDGLLFNDVVYSYTGEGTAYGYELSLNIVNNYAKKDALGVMTWTSTISGTASGATIGIGIEKSVSGTITNVATKKIF